jgi:hypothetical protein
MFDPAGVDVSEEMTVSTRIRALADSLTQEFGFSIAESKLVGALIADDELANYAVRAFAHSEIHMAMAVRRKRIQGAPEPIEMGSQTVKHYSKDVGIKVGEWAGRFLGWPLSTHKLLRDASLQDVRAEAEMYEGQAQGNARNGRFMRLVERRLVTLKIKDGETVGKVLDDAILARLMAKASQAQAA